MQRIRRIRECGRAPLRCLLTGAKIRRLTSYWHRGAAPCSPKVNLCHCLLASATAITLNSHAVNMQTNSFLLSCARVLMSMTVVACTCDDQSMNGCAADAASNAALSQVASSTSMSSSQDGPAKGCKIKGNINSKGEKIYHMPGGRYYDSTQIDIPQGERWFCTERQAKDAGWRASQ